MAGNSTKAPRSLVLWILLCAFANGTGWSLSAIRFLNPTGYSVALLVGIVLIVTVRPQLLAVPDLPRTWRKTRKRFRRPLPLAFLILAAMAFLSGMAYAPNNYDALAY